MITSFHILSNSSFTYHPFIWHYIFWVTEKASLNKLHINKWELLGLYDWKHTPSNEFFMYGNTNNNRGSIPGRDKRMFPLASVSRSALGPTQPPVQWILGVLSSGLKRSRAMTLTTHPNLVPRSRMCRSYTSPTPQCLLGMQWKKCKQ
jgi:hypothetical protein